MNEKVKAAISILEYVRSEVDDLHPDLLRNEISNAILILTNTPQQDERFVMAQDSSSHWYFIPVSRSKEWAAWCELDEEDPLAWEAPEWAVETGGCYSRITFTDPILT